MSNPQNEFRGGYQPSQQNMHKVGDGYQPRGSQPPSSSPPPPPKGGTGASVPLFHSNPNNTTKK